MAASCGWPSDGRSQRANNGLIQLALQFSLAVDFIAPLANPTADPQASRHPLGRSECEKVDRK